MTISINGWLIAFCISFTFNIAMLLYVRYLLRILVSSSERVKEFNDEIISFAAHVKGISELETFYGDETIGGLLRHSLQIVNVAEGFSEIMDITEPNSEDTIEEQDDEQQDNAETQEAPRPEVQAEVFYAGTRRRNN